MACYLVSDGATVCDCPTQAAPVHSACAVYTDCFPGLICISGVNGSTTPTCEATCAVANPACPQGEQCVPVTPGANYGYCAAM
jgi:hypothetical protein